ncbi:hypothetical protein GKC34_03270, partial [Lactobacillus salivarius]|nr:hypothetical protein [Ligilactobacillus salivarius]
MGPGFDPLTTHQRLYSRKNFIILPVFIIGSLSKRTDAKILIIIFKLLDESLIV